MVSDSLSAVRECSQYTQIFNPFLFWAIARARGSPIDWMKMRFCRCNAEMFDIISNIQKIQNWNINQFFIDNDYNFHFVVVRICLDANKEREEERERVKFFCHHAFSANRMPSFFLRFVRYQWQWYCNHSYWFFNLTDGGKTTTAQHHRQIEVCWFLPIFRLISSPSPGVVNSLFPFRILHPNQSLQICICKKNKMIE